MTFKTALASLGLAGVLLVPELPAQELQFKTAELRGFHGPQDAEFVPVATRRRTTRRYVVKKRSKKKSAAIVGGSAAAGAAIGALAGGGKGAAIGAIAGGGGGFIYDRHTHKKVVRK